MKRGKKGVSPVIATVLLVAIGLVLAIIIFLWARSFIGEKVQKNDRAVESSCEEASFIAEAVYSTRKINIENTGNIPLYGVEVRKKTIGGWDTINAADLTNTISNGETDSVDLPLGISSGETILVVPVLLGETSTNIKAHVCDKDYGKEVVVG